jgi:hypothetical protein
MTDLVTAESETVRYHTQVDTLADPDTVSSPAGTTRLLTTPFSLSKTSISQWHQCRYSWYLSRVVKPPTSVSGSLVLGWHSTRRSRPMGSAPAMLGPVWTWVS